MRLAPRSLRGRLVAASTAVLLVALIAFGAGALVLVDRTQRVVLDERTRVAASAIAVIPDIVGDRLVFDAADGEQFSRIVGAALDGELVDTRGTVVATTSRDVPPGIRAIANGRSYAAGISTVRDRESLRVAVAPITRNHRTYGAAIVWGGADFIDDLDQRLAVGLVLAIPLLLAAAVAGASFAAQRTLQPIDDLAALASEIEGYDLSRRIGPRDNDDELGRLCSAFDRMLDRLEAVFEGQRRFTSDASHEFRAPLSVIRAEADLALSKPRSAEEYRRALGAIASQADSLEALTRNLLAAARGAASVRTMVDANDVMHDAAATVAGLAGEHGVTLTVEGSGPLHVRADFATLSRAVVCVLHNALEHTPRGGTVTLRGAAAGRAVSMTVHDAGQGFSAEALLHGAERFWRDDAARSPRPSGDETNGTGLGLAIAKAIVEAAGGTLALANDAGGGAHVTLEIPAADVPG